MRAVVLPPCLPCGGPSPTCAYCGCRRARPCEICPVRCCFRRDAEAWLDDVGGSLDLDGLPWVRVPLPDLPPLVPVLGGPVSPLPPWPAWGIRWDLFLSRDGTRAQPRWLVGRRSQDVVGAPPDVAMVLTLVGPDPAIEGLWTRQWSGRLWEAVARAGFDLVIGPNYSVYGDQPRFEHRLNIKRSLLAALRLRLLGVPAVPSVYAWRLEDVDALGRWARSAGLDAAAVNMQTFRSAREWTRALAILLALRDALPPGVRWFFPGVASKARVETLRGLFPGCVVLTLWPYQCAAHGRRIRPDGRTERWPARPAELLEENLRAVAAWGGCAT